MHKFSKDVTLDDKFARAVTIEPPWERITIFNWNDLRGMYDRIAELERELDEARKGMHTTEEVEKAVRKVASIWPGGETDTFMKRVMTALTAPNPVPSTSAFPNLGKRDQDFDVPQAAPTEYACTGTAVYQPPETPFEGASACARRDKFTLEQIRDAAHKTGFSDAAEEIIAVLYPPPKPKERVSEKTLGVMGYTIYLHGHTGDGLGKEETVPVCLAFDVRELAAELNKLNTDKHEDAHE